MDHNDTLVVISDGHTQNTDHNDTLAVITQSLAASDGHTEHGS